MSATDEKKGPSPHKKRGRPRAFEPDAVLPQAMETFLRYGYAGASLEALTTSMGVNKPSLYATFGDKRALFRRVIEARVKELGRRYRRAFDRGDSVESSLRAVFEEAVAINVNAGGAPGCIIGSAAAGISTAPMPTPTMCLPAIMRVSGVGTRSRRPPARAAGPPRASGSPSPTPRCTSSAPR